MDYFRLKQSLCLNYLAYVDQEILSSLKTERVPFSENCLAYFGSTLITSGKRLCSEREARAAAPFPVFPVKFATLQEKCNETFVLSV